MTTPSSLPTGANSSPSEEQSSTEHLHPPRDLDLQNTDVVVIYKGDAGYLEDNDKSVLESFVKRGGGWLAYMTLYAGRIRHIFSELLGGEEAR